jgi:hypothetical protein
MNPVVHVLRRMGGHATTLLPFSLAIGLLFQNLSAAARPLLWPLAVALLMLALAAQTGRASGRCCAGPASPSRRRSPT